jgi:hypothetical protein
VTADFPPYNATVTRTYDDMDDNAKVSDLKHKVSQDGAVPGGFRGQAGNMEVWEGDDLLDHDADLTDGHTYEIHLTPANLGNDDGGVQGMVPGTGTPTDGNPNAFGGGVDPVALSARLAQLTVQLYVNDSGQMDGPFSYPVPAESTVATLKDQVAVNPPASLGSVTSTEIAVWDGKEWVNDNAPIAENVTYTMQRIAPA